MQRFLQTQHPPEPRVRLQRKRNLRSRPSAQEPVPGVQVQEMPGSQDESELRDLCPVSSGMFLFFFKLFFPQSFNLPPPTLPIPPSMFANLEHTGSCHVRETPHSTKPIHDPRVRSLNKNLRGVSDPSQVTVGLDRPPGPLLTLLP
ncbi:hypothetical protein ElyMa_004833300 [Elysia marginata]|uniref:Uncharacterized protein n=1 Tax=Elysia marginata TaxID=1093978 RepID=A0AAV4IMS6_9GAST|nr:hypothetical protein ElyMa_004833300 [Elysia marginata]